MADCTCQHDCFSMIEELNEFRMWQGLVGPTFFPSVDESGNLSWSNNGNLTNPATVNIMGPSGKGIEISGIVASEELLPETAQQGQVWAVGSDSDYDGYVYLGGWIDLGPILQAGPAGENGVTFTPHLAQNGELSWTNDGGLPNPETVNIMGQPGADGDDGVTFTPSVSSAGVISWTNDGDLPNPESVNIKGPAGQDGVSPTVAVTDITGGHAITITDADHPSGQTVNVMDGEDGDDGENGATFTPAVASNGDLSWSNDKGLPNPQTVNIKGPQGDGVPSGGTAGQVLRKTADGTEWHSPDAGDAAYDGTETYTSGTVGAGIKANAASIASLIQESAFEIEVEDGEYVLYWYGAAGECPYTVEFENGEYVLYFTYSTT